MKSYLDILINKFHLTILIHLKIIYTYNIAWMLVHRSPQIIQVLYPFWTYQIIQVIRSIPLEPPPPIPSWLFFCEPLVLDRLGTLHPRVFSTDASQEGKKNLWTMPINETTVLGSVNQHSSNEDLLFSYNLNY